MNEDLWALAASRLKEKDRACVNLNPSGNINDIVESVERRRQECVDKQWAVPRGSNRDAVVLRDVFTRIAVWINKFMAVGDIAVQYDPGHAALPWALIRFLLKVSVQNVQQYLIIAQGVEHVTLALTHYNIVERLHLTGNNESTIRLRNSLTDLYTRILKFLIKAQGFYEKNRAIQNIFSGKLSRLLNDIKEQEKTVNQYIGLVDAESRGDLERTLESLSTVERENFRNLKDILQDLQRPLNQIEQDFRVLHDGLTIAERIRILQWISPIPYMQHHNQARRDVLAGTGAWLLKHEMVLGWLGSSSSSIMWLHGIAGSGKSKLMSIFIEERLNDAERESNACPIYFYCTKNSAEPERATSNTILRSLVRQLACSTSDRTILEPVKELYKLREQNSFAAGPLTSDESTALIIQLSQDRPLTTIFIDGLDECDLSSRGDLLDALSRILQDSRSLVKILVSSRADVDIVRHFSDCLNLKIEASKNQGDIEYYINSEVDNLIDRQKLLYGKVSEELKQTIKTVLREQAQGMFRWVSLQLQSLCALRTEVLIRKRLGELPATLRDLYQETYVKQLGGYEEEERLTAEAVLRLLMCLREPLSTRDFLRALEFCREERISVSIDGLLGLCANFIILDTELDVFRFAHLSVREFLEKKEGFDAASNHAIAAGCCLRYLLDVQPRYESNSEDDWITVGKEGLEVQDRATTQNLCHEYICLYWPFHLHESSAYRHGPPLRALFWRFMLDDQNSMTHQFIYWNDLMSWDGRRYELSRVDYLSKPANFMFVASAWNFCDVLQYCISRDSYAVHLEASYRRSTPLHLACRYGSVDAAELLIDNGAELEAMDGRGMTPMLEAVRKGYTTIVRLLLENGAKPGSESDPESVGYTHGLGTNLCVAASRGFLDVVKALLDAGADPDWRGDYDLTVIDFAIYKGNLAMVRMILESGGQTNKIKTTACIKASQLFRAVVNGDEAGVREILREWPITEMSAQYLNMALWKAAHINQKTIMQLLLAKGADMNSHFQYTPVLFKAARPPDSSWLDERRIPLVQCLLRQGADPHVCVPSSETLFLQALAEDKFNLARILLEEGADINEGGPVTPPLLYIAKEGSLDAARFLLQRGVDIETRGQLYEQGPEVMPQSALYWARWSGRSDMVELLYQYGAKDGPGSCPYQHEPESCPFDHRPGGYPHELGWIEEVTDETEVSEIDEVLSDEASNDRSEVS